MNIATLVICSLSTVITLAYVWAMRPIKPRKR